MASLSSLPPDVLYMILFLLISYVPSVKDFLQFTSLNRTLHAIYTSSLSRFNNRMHQVHVPPQFRELSIAMAHIFTHDRKTITPAQFQVALAQACSKDRQSTETYQSASRIHRKISKIALRTAHTEPFWQMACKECPECEPDFYQKFTVYMKHSTSPNLSREQKLNGYNLKEELYTDNENILRLLVGEEGMKGWQKHVTLQEYDMRLLYAHFMRHYPWKEWGDEFRVDLQSSLITVSGFDHRIEQRTETMNNGATQSWTVMQFRPLIRTLRGWVDIYMRGQFEIVADMLTEQFERVKKESHWFSYEDGVLRHKWNYIIRREALNHLSVDDLNRLIETTPNQTSADFFASKLKELFETGLNIDVIDPESPDAEKCKLSINYQDHRFVVPGALDENGYVTEWMPMLLPVTYKNLPEDDCNWITPEGEPWNQKLFLLWKEKFENDYNGMCEWVNYGTYPY